MIQVNHLPYKPLKPQHKPLLPYPLPPFLLPCKMACSSSIIGVSSVYQTTPLEHSRRPNSAPPLSLLCGPEKSLFSGLKVKKASNGNSSFVASAVVTPNSSFLSETAFKGLGGFGEDSLEGSESEYESQGEDFGEDKVVDENELEVSKLGLPQKLVETLERRGITSLFPIQRSVLTPALEGRDIIARAKTGTGKTLAFGIPIIKKLSEDEELSFSRRRSGRLPRVLVLAPTRELAKQVEKEIKESAPFLNTVCVYGGVSYVTQQSALTRGVDVVVGTPGRLIDLINNGSLKLGEVEFLVLDEADQMLAVGFEEDVELILGKLPAQRQSMLFSATMPGWVKKLARKYLDNPLTVDLVGDDEEKLAEGIKLFAIPASGTSKKTILSDLITVYARGGKTIVFTQTKRDADEVSLALSSSIASEALHGDISQHQRERTLNSFRQGKFTVLVATDVASRGLDIPNVDLVIHYELPNDPETFVHRSGRTGRAGKEGRAILMFSGNQRRTVKSLEHDVGCRFDFISPPSIEEVLESSAEHVVATLAGVHSESISYFTPTAQKLMEERGVDALAAALAHLSGFSQPPSSRSLITHEQGWTTLQLTREPSASRGFLSTRSVTGFLASVYSTAADELGKIHLTADTQVQGAVFDLPEDIARELLTKEIPPGNSIFKISKLPALQDDGPANDFYGRFSSRDRGSRGGYSRGGRGGSRSSSSRSSWSSSSRFSDDDGDDFKRGGRGGGRSPSRFSDSDIDFRRGGERGGDRGGRSDWLIGGDRRGSGSRPGRPSFGNSDRNFAGACFNCGRSGHRASECPTKQGF